MNPPDRRRPGDPRADQPEPDRPADEGLAELLGAAGPRPSAPPEVSAEVHATVRVYWLRTVPVRRSDPWRRGWVAWAAAAGVVLVAGVGWWTGRPGAGGGPGTATSLAVAEAVAVRGVVWAEEAEPGRRQAVEPGVLMAAGRRLATGHGGHLALRMLAGGPTIRLDGDSRVEIASAELVTLLDGALYLDSGAAPAATRTVEVGTVRGRVREMGTRFEVRLLPGALRVRVRDGAVAVEVPGRSLRAAAGTELAVGADGSVSRRPVLPYDEVWDWVLDAVPPFDSDGKTLDDLLTWIGRETGLEVRYTDPAVRSAMARETLHGRLGWTRPDRLADAVLPAFGLEARVEGGSLVVERQK